MNFFDTGMMVVVLKQVGTTVVLREMSKTSVRTSALFCISSGPAAFRGLTLSRVFLSSEVDRHSTWLLEERGAFLAITIT